MGRGYLRVSPSGNNKIKTVFIICYNSTVKLTQFTLKFYILLLLEYKQNMFFWINWFFDFITCLGTQRFQGTQSFSHSLTALGFAIFPYNF